MNGTLYGTTYKGGIHGLGTVFSIGTSGAEQVLHSFAGGSDGASPLAGLIDVHGTLYGTTTGLPGSSGDGTVFSISTTGTEHVLHNFGSSSTYDGLFPFAGLISVNGTLYGTTIGGGAYGGGAVFALTP